MKNKVTYSTIIEQIAKDTGTPKNLVHDFLKGAVEVIDEGLVRDGRVSIAGLGIFALKWHKARPGTNPQTGEPIVIPAHNRIHFKPAVNLRQFINRKNEQLKPVILPHNLNDKQTSTDTLEPKPAPEVVSLPKPGVDTVPKTKPAPELKPEPKPVVTAEPETVLESGHLKTEDKKTKPMMWIPIMVIILLLLVFAGYFLFKPSDKTQLEMARTDESAKATATAKDNTPQPAAAKKQTDTPQTDNHKDTKQIEEMSKQEKSEPSPQYIDTKEDNALADSSDELKGTEYIIQAGESLWTLSTSKYSEPYFWPYIYRVNLEIIKDPDLLENGLTILAPDMEGTTDNLSLRDRKYLADGYIQAYLTYRKLGKRKAILYLWVADQLNTPEVIKKYDAEIRKSDLDIISKVKGTSKIQ